MANSTVRAILVNGMYKIEKKITVTRGFCSTDWKDMSLQDVILCTLVEATKVSGALQAPSSM